MSWWVTCTFHPACQVCLGATLVAHDGTRKDLKLEPEEKLGKGGAVPIAVAILRTHRSGAVNASSQLWVRPHESGEQESFEDLSVPCVLLMELATYSPTAFPVETGTKKFVFRLREHILRTAGKLEVTLSLERTPFLSVRANKLTINLIGRLLASVSSMLGH